MKNVLKSTLAILLLLLFMYFIYPTRYIYLEARLVEYPVRVDRLTGEAEFLTPYGWQHAKQKSN